MKYIYLYSLLVIAAGIAGCTPKTGSHSPSLITEINWGEMTEERKPLPQPLPLVCDIAEMTTYDSMILLKSDKTAPAFNILPTDLKKSTAFGTYGRAQEELSLNVQMMHNSGKELKLYDNYAIKEFKYENDSVVYLKTTNGKTTPNFYQYICSVNDTLCCVYKLAPKETGVHLVNLLTQESYDSISVAQGYFDNKDIPYDLVCHVYRDKLIIGRSKFNQIELYNINTTDKRLVPASVINYKNASAENYIKEGACYMYNINADEKYFYMLNQDTDKFGEKTYIDVYSWDGNPVRRIELDDLYLMGVLIDNTFYLKKYTDDDNLYILKL